MLFLLFVSEIPVASPTASYNSYEEPSGELYRAHAVDLIANPIILYYLYALLCSYILVCHCVYTTSTT